MMVSYGLIISVFCHDTISRVVTIIIIITIIIVFCKPYSGRSRVHIIIHIWMRITKKKFFITRIIFGPIANHVFFFKKKKLFRYRLWVGTQPLAGYNNILCICILYRAIPFERIFIIANICDLLENKQLWV